MARRRHRAAFETGEVYPASSLLRLWIMRLLVPLGGRKHFVDKDFFNGDELASAIGLEKWLEPERDFDVKEINAELHRMYLESERMARNATIPTCLARNVARLSTLVGLSETDCQVLAFVVTLKNENMLREAADTIGHELSTVKTVHILATVLDIPERDIRASFSPQGMLARSHIITVDSDNNDLTRKFGLLSDKFADSIYSADSDPISLIRDRVAPAKPAQLVLEDFEHIAPCLAILRPYLKNALASRRQGINIFLHGKPGTGKSQLAKILAQDIEHELFEVACEDGDGDPVNGEERLRALRAAQYFFGESKALLVFDEVEDIFSNGGWFHPSTAQSHKAWMNRMLEENTMPVIWISNSIRRIDPAFMRRFDMVIEVPLPSQKQRKRLLQTLCVDVLDRRAITRFAASESLAPAVVSKAADVVRSIRNELGEQKVLDVEGAFELLVNNTLEAQSHRPVRRHDPNRLPEVYDPQFIHADVDLSQIAEGLVQSRAGRLCLYGPPGTGKTAYGRWLAERLDMPLLVKRASDLVSMWVGETEKNMARAFHDAEREGALLLIDEVDSFLQDRRAAQNSWEVTAVNEMLTQMEAFSGVFIASTNLMEGLDQAALRRFDLKVKFDFLRSEQAWELLRRHCAQLKLPAPPTNLQNRVTRMNKLTPGDFAAVIRQNRFHPVTTPVMLVAALESECALKDGSGAQIGFLT
ncbi:ATPase [Betaproteobacteria bacterium]|nr:ATPase [Betaproteobacteria bacterium]GHT99770.1 ATPase [Betaproteobacteria bacterium]GHU30586.1 ATPase [Betaproteobacteria bacterium]